jgi:ERCC4-type nuclease
MILIDNRVGSKELAKYFPPTTQTAITYLAFADFAFVGNCKDNNTIMVGIERKTIGDLLDCIKSGRFTGHQIPGLMENYGRIYVVLEGIWRPHNGSIQHYTKGSWSEMPRNTILYGQLLSFMASCEEFAGVRFIQTPTPQATAEAIDSLYWYWQKPYESHQSHLKFKSVNLELSPLTRPTTLVKVLAQLPGLGAKKAQLAAKHFGSIYDAIISLPEDWAEIPGIGKDLANKIVKTIREVRHGNEN